MIDHINDTWAKIGVSKIDGVGVIAIRDIPKGTKIGAQSERTFFCTSLDGVLPEVKKLILQRWPLAEKGYPFLAPNGDARLLSFMNHSATPNYDPKTDCVLVDIKESEEITEDYGDNPGFPA